MTILTRTVVTVLPLRKNEEPINMELELGDPGKIIITFGSEAAEYELKDIYDALKILQKEREEQTLSKSHNTIGGLPDYV